MDNNKPATEPSRPVAKPAPVTSIRQFPPKAKLKKKDLYGTITSSAGFLLVMGGLIAGFGILCAFPFPNRFNYMVLSLGLIMAMAGILIKIVDVFIKIVGGRA